MPRLSRKQAGACYTPDAVVANFVRWVVRKDTDRLRAIEFAADEHRVGLPDPSGERRRSLGLHPEVRDRKWS